MTPNYAFNADQPIAIDGHRATIMGREPLRAD